LLSGAEIVILGNLKLLIFSGI